MKLKPSFLIVFSGLIWLAVGVYLMQMGIGFLVEGKRSALAQAGETPLLTWLHPYVGGAETAALLLVAVALLIGYLKGKHVLGKAARRGVDRILSLPKPIALSRIYAPRYYLLLGLMICIGLSMKWFGISKDWRGFVDIAVGAALINGAMIYFRLARLKPETE